MKLLQELHIVKGWSPQDITAGLTSDAVSMKLYHHLTILFHFGNTAVAPDVDWAVNAHPDVAMSATVALNNYTMRKSAGGAAALGDLWAVETTITDSKIDYVAAGDIVPDTDDDCIVAIDMDGDQVAAAAAGYDCVSVTVPAIAAACICGCLFILSRPRYAQNVMPTAIAD